MFDNQTYSAVDSGVAQQVDINFAENNSTNTHFADTCQISWAEAQTNLKSGIWVSFGNSCSITPLTF
jgi:hypothetical protein